MSPDFIYGTAWKEERTAELTLLALRCGFRAIDTANQRRHYFEAGVGEGIAAAIREGLVRREELFIQTKFTSPAAQDHRLPFDAFAPVAKQVNQSLTSSLKHLGIGMVDSFVLHGPAAGSGWSDEDAATWLAMCRERDAGRARQLGVSNISVEQLKALEAAGGERPALVQNRCYARLGWDRDVRVYCRKNGIAYQGFSILTANASVVKGPLVTAIAQRHKATNAQIVFRFMTGIGVVPLTGTSDAEHMRQDLDSKRIRLTPADLKVLETVAG